MDGDCDIPLLETVQNSQWKEQSNLVSHCVKSSSATELEFEDGT